MREGLITNEYGQPASPISLTPVLLDSQIQRLSDAAEGLIKSLPPMDPKLATNKKRISKELEVCLFLTLYSHHGPAAVRVLSSLVEG